MNGPAEETHYFPPGRSLARRVHGDRAVGLLYGQRALLIGALEPLTYTGTMLTTKAGGFPFAHRARHLSPHSLRRGRNDLFFDAVTRSERLRGGTATPQLTIGLH